MPRTILTALTFSLLLCVGLNRSTASNLETLVSFDPQLGELPEGIAVRPGDGAIFVGLFGASEIRGIDPTNGATVFSSSVPNPAGISFTPYGQIVAATVAGFFDPNLPPERAGDHGVWLVEADGSASSIAALPIGSTLPNDTAIGSTGEIYVSDSLGGRIYLVENGAASVWVEDSLLVGDPSLPGLPGRPPVPIGVNGIEVHDGSMFAVNGDFGSVVKIPILPNGQSGELEVLIQDSRLIGVDSIEFRADGAMFLATSANEILQLHDDLSLSVLATAVDGLETPANTAFGVGEFANDLFIANFAFFNVNNGVPASPSVLVLDTSKAVPEPTAVVLALCAAPLLGLIRLRKTKWDVAWVGI